MTSMNVLRQEAAAIGITDAEARKYGDLRHKRTWSLAIEHHLSMQDFADGTASDSDSTLNDSQTEESKDYGIQLTANLGESGVKRENTTGSPVSSQQPEMAILSEGNAYGRSRHNSDHRSNPNRGFKQVVQNHIKALTIASASRTVLINSQLNNWVCPECYPEGELSCHLCAGEGNVSDIAAIGWTLAYMEMLGCSAREIEPLRKISPASETLELNLKSCVAIKKSTEVLARTEKWVIGNR
ncbi:MAG: hypothetical protein JGK17_11915 [Microcoleus sp. PH2017_10_PVI_O_A]|nr:hypothetical protein [Microcoleus sp. PH2017_10_PVI_O_A]MCC3460257.1 hypothetical protein [Microcoleus sp. PH2017_11_PCY_U_A]MCC3478791.1 hypothetical protein [Microcoleus sp. PH2017_12_PCY_D_A]MCC3528404.1 hypothetical protein [Microcoleus sp. PH2017_21_RUC_O_A]MCC3540580.1 hypothetical protein [Microcoleus sp. PH2017_22_RUC_O_B]MCC3559725.1 hypothetical protein [Microcoleus sp. PH2017_27_LUM_O_A]TAE83197.1 MAG: hypothetical protein EAZ83_10255 [Oscillatoriales cyanobacterium]